DGGTPHARPDGGRDARRLPGVPPRSARGRRGRRRAVDDDRQIVAPPESGVGRERSVADTEKDGTPAQLTLPGGGYGRSRLRHADDHVGETARGERAGDHRRARDRGGRGQDGELARKERELLHDENAVVGAEIAFEPLSRDE